MVMSIFSIIVVAICLLMIISTAVQHHRKKITAAWGIFWGGLWALGALTVIFVGFTDTIGKYFINGEGRWLVIYLAIIALFYICYRLFLAIQKLNSSVSKLVEELAKRK